MKVETAIPPAECRPNFFLAGPNRTGSTWLFRRLACHPQVFMSTPKEIHYFSTLGRPEHELHVSDDLGWYLEHFRITDDVRERREAEARSRFQRGFEPLVRGEGSASYAADLTHGRLADIAALFPDLKVVITVRDPVERAWSHAKFDLTILRNRALHDVTEAEIEAMLEHPYVLSCGRYSEMYARWLRHFPGEQILVILFDRIKSDPVGLCSEIARFLGVDDDSRIFETPEDEVARNATEPTERVPEPYATKLRAYYADELVRLRAWFGNLTW